MKEPFQGVPRQAHGKRQDINGKGLRPSRTVPPHSHAARRGA